MTTTLRKILGDRPVHTVTPDTSLRDAARMMADHKVGALAVVTGDALVGILSERDIVFKGTAAALPSDTTPVSEIMTPDPVTVDIDDKVSDALAAKLGDAFRHLPVMEAGHLAGLLSYRDIPAQYVMMFERFREMATSHADDGA
ncbi:MAG: CBS domain-containing protein [Rhodobacteraceae bacterium]|nr:CBS domain-containing protein [Paracoccaceae bacterium]